MRKIPTLFVRDEKTFRVTPVVRPGLENVLAPKDWPENPYQAYATVKIDGTACRWTQTGLQLRASHPTDKLYPPDFVPVEINEEGTKMYGWRPLTALPEDEWARQAIVGGVDNKGQRLLESATYELIGPKIQNTKKNPYPDQKTHVLVEHGSYRIEDMPRPWSFESIRAWLEAHAVEGIVFYANAIGVPLAKIKRTDFGMEWPI